MIQTADVVKVWKIVDGQNMYLEPAVIVFVDAPQSTFDAYIFQRTGIAKYFQNLPFYRLENPPQDAVAPENEPAAS